MRYYAVALAMTFGLLVWWLYALVVPVHFATGRDTSNAIGFNVVLLLVVALSWVIAVALADKAEAERRKK